MAYSSSITATLGSPIGDTAHLDSDGATGTITVHLRSDSSCTSEVDTAETHNGSDPNPPYTVTANTSLPWKVICSGDDSHDGAECCKEEYTLAIDNDDTV